MIDVLTEWATSGATTEYLLAASGLILLAIFVALIVNVRSLRHTLGDAQEELVDKRTGLLPRSAIPVRLTSELQWALAAETPMSIAVIKIRGNGFVRAAQTLRAAMRGEEQAYLFRRGYVILSLWGTSLNAALAAVDRLTDSLAAAGWSQTVCGIATAGDDGTEVEELIAAASQRRRPLCKSPTRSNAHDNLLKNAARSTPKACGYLRYRLSMLWSVLFWSGVQVALLISAWRLLPELANLSLSSSASSSLQTTPDPISLLRYLSALIALPIAAALVQVAAWNIRPGRLPASRPFGSLGAPLIVAIALVVGAPLSVAALLERTDLLDTIDNYIAAPALLAFSVFVLTVLLMLISRQLVHCSKVVALLGSALFVGGTWLITDHYRDQVTLLTISQLMAVIFVGAFLSTLIDRRWWLVTALAVSTGVYFYLDAWSPQISRYFEIAHPIYNGLGSGAGSLLILLAAALIIFWGELWGVDQRLITASLITLIALGFMSGTFLFVAISIFGLLLCSGSMFLLGRRRRRARRGLSLA